MSPRDDYFWPTLCRQYAAFLESIGYVEEGETDTEEETDDDEIPEGYLIATDSESDWSDDDDDDLPSMEEVARLSN